MTMAALAPPRRSNVAEKYVNMRTQSFTRTHAQALQSWIDSGRGDADAYFAAFRAQSEASIHSYNRDIKRIEEDSQMNWREKEREKIARGERVIWPSWSERQEQAFLTTYGDPRELDRAGLESRLNDLEGPDWEHAQRPGHTGPLPKKPFEMLFLGAIVDPQDGSVPVWTNRKKSTTAPIVISDMSEAQRAALEWGMRLMCPHCGIFKDTLKSRNMHVHTCPKNPDRRIVNQRAKAPGLTVKDEPKPEIELVDEDEGSELAQSLVEALEADDAK